MKPTLNLYYDGSLIGTISDPDFDSPWLQGKVQLNAKGEELRPFYEWMEENELDQDPPFDPALFDSERWCVELEGYMIGIDMPSIRRDGTIDWRWSNPEEAGMIFDSLPKQGR